MNEKFEPIDAESWPYGATHLLVNSNSRDGVNKTQLAILKTDGFYDLTETHKFVIGEGDWLVMKSKQDILDMQKKAKLNSPEGQKHDQDKAMMGLIPPLAELSVADVLTFGAKKYAPENWRKVDNAHSRYMDAAKRHINAYHRGESHDQESGLPHLSHAICCLMFMQELDLEKEMEDEKTP